MTRYSVQSTDIHQIIFVKGYESLSFAKSRGKNIGINISKNFIVKYSQKLLNHARQSETDAHKTSSKRVNQKQQKQMVV